MRKSLIVASGLLLLPLFSGGPSGCGNTSSPPSGGEGATFALSVVLSGSGTVTSEPAGIDCGTDCSETLAEGTQLVLTATPTTGFAFSGWSGGGCAGTGTCSLDLAADTEVTASFTEQKTLSMTVTGAGRGTVVSNVEGVGCSTDEGACEANLDVGSQIMLTATPEPGYLFAGWDGGGCQGARSACAVTLDAATSVRAAFIMAAFASIADFDDPSVPNLNGTYNVWVAKTDGTEARPVTRMTADGADSFSPRWSPDGTRLVFESRRALDGSNAVIAGFVMNIWVIDAGEQNDGDPAATSARPLTRRTLNNAVNYGPQWSPDGTKIVYSSNRALDQTGANNVNNVSNIWVIGADERNDDNASLTSARPLTRMTFSGAFSSDPQWSPDGSLIAFESERSLDKGNSSIQIRYGIWVIGANETHDDNPSLTSARPVTEITQAHSYFPQWSPDGSRIVFQSYRQLDRTDASMDNVNIWTIDAGEQHDDNPSLTSAKPLTRITVTGVDSFAPRWSPDGTEVVFGSYRALDKTDASNGASNIWLIDADESLDDDPALTSAQPLTQLHNARSDSPEWSPDGTKILFRSTRLPNGNDAPTSNCTNNPWTMDPDGGRSTPLMRLLDGEGCT